MALSGRPAWLDGPGRSGRRTAPRPAASGDPGPPGGTGPPPDGRHPTGTDRSLSSGGGAARTSSGSPNDHDRPVVGAGVIGGVGVTVGAGAVGGAANRRRAAPGVARRAGAAPACSPHGPGSGAGGASSRAAMVDGRPNRRKRDTAVTGDRVGRGAWSSRLRARRITRGTRRSRACNWTAATLGTGSGARGGTAETVCRWERRPVRRQVVGQSWTGSLPSESCRYRSVIPRRAEGRSQPRSSRAPTTSSCQDAPVRRCTQRLSITVR